MWQEFDAVAHGEDTLKPSQVYSHTKARETLKPSLSLQSHQGTGDTETLSSLQSHKGTEATLKPCVKKWKYLSSLVTSLLPAFLYVLVWLSI